MPRSPTVEALRVVTCPFCPKKTQINIRDKKLYVCACGSVLKGKCPRCNGFAFIDCSGSGRDKRKCKCGQTLVVVCTRCGSSARQYSILMLTGDEKRKRCRGFIHHNMLAQHVERFKPKYEPSKLKGFVGAFAADTRNKKRLNLAGAILMGVLLFALGPRAWRMSKSTVVPLASQIQKVAARSLPQSPFSGHKSSRPDQIIRKAHLWPVSAIIETKDGKLISAGWDKQVRVWVRKSGRYIGKPPLARQSDWISGLAIASNGDLISSDWRGRARIWQLRNSLYGESQSISREGDRSDLASANSVNVPVGKHILAWRQEPGSYKRAAFEPLASNSPVAAAAGIADQHRISLLRLGGWRMTSVLADAKQITALTMTARSTIVSGDERGYIRIYRSNGSVYRRVESFAAHSSPVMALTISPNGALVSAAENEIKIWRPNGKHYQEERKLSHPEDWVSALAITRDGALIAGDWDGNINIWLALFK